MATSALNGFEMGNFKDSINATLMISAVANPIQASFTRLLIFIKQIENYNRLSRLFEGSIYITNFLFGLAQAYYYLFVVTVIHDVAFGRVWLPLAITSALAIILIMIVMYCIDLWRKMHEPDLPIQP